MALRRLWSIRARLALWHAASLSVILALLGFAAVGLQDRSLRADIDDDLRLIAAGAVDLLAVGASPEAAAAALAQLEEPELVRPFYRITPSEGVAIEGGTWPAALGIEGGRRRSGAPPRGFWTEQFPDGEARMFADGVTRPGGGGLVEVGTTLDKLEAARGRFVQLFVVIGPLGVGLAALGGYALAARALRPVAEITERARTLSVGALGKARLPIANPDDELGRLTTTINAMLDRLARAVDEIRRFSADASHELKTPLTILRGQLELACEGEPGPQAYRAVLDSSLEEVDRMTRIVERLLRLARAEAGEVGYERMPVALERLAGDVADQLRGRAEAAGVRLAADLREPTTVLGDDLRLRELVVILLDNAIRYTPAGGSVRLGVERGPAWVSLVVEDTGCGIPADALPRVFEPFFRADPSRARDGGGSGLGLTIARATVEGHGGEIGITSEVGVGTRVTVRLPVSARS